MSRVPAEIVNSRCCVRSAFALRSALAANRLTLRSKISARAMLLHASVCRGRRAHHATTPSQPVRTNWGARSRMPPTRTPPSIGSFQLDEDAIAEQGEDDERYVENEPRDLEHTLADAVEVRQEAQRRHGRNQESR